jgi:catechol 2,3-dioxygenase-like lactoylglutathione lyase family enzyme
VTAGPDVVIDRITLIVSDLDRAQEDYVRTFGCRVVHRADIEPALTGVLCLRRARGRRSLLRLGRERIELLEFTDSAGRPYPPDSTSTDLWFQHMAIVVNDMPDAYQRVMANRRFRPISRNGPVRLPDSSGGVTAFKFRDHDGHPLELLAFPEGHAPAAWRNGTGGGSFLGVDHTAIAVSDTASSAGFFGSVFGFKAGTRTENHGPEQAALDDIEAVCVSVTRLGPDLPAPRMELLRYHAGTRRPVPADTASNDIVATHSVVRVASLDAIAAALARRGTPLADCDFMILRGGMRAVLVAGPDGHRFLVEERPDHASVGQVLGDQLGDLRLLRGEHLRGPRTARPGRLAGGAQLGPGPAGEGPHAHRVEHPERGTQLVPGVAAASLAAQPLAIEEVGAGEVGTAPRAAEPPDRLAIVLLSGVWIAAQRA